MEMLSDLTKQQGASEDFTHQLKEAIIDMQNTVMTAQGAALAAQATQMQLTSRIAQLEQEAARVNDWDNEKARYELAQTERRPGQLAYKLREEAKQEGEPTHYICTTCYEEGVKSILQTINGRPLLCPRCLKMSQKVASNNAARLTP